MTSPFIHVVSLSGGKDSQATAELAIGRVPKERIRLVFADTGNEDAAVYTHLDYLEAVLGIPIVRLKVNFDERIRVKRMFIARDRRVRKQRRTRTLKDGSTERYTAYVRWTNKAKRRALGVLHPTGNPYLDLCLWKGRFPARRSQFCTQELKTIPLVEYQMELIDAGYNVISWQGIRRDESANRRNAKLMERVAPHLWSFRPIIHWTGQQTIDYCLSRGHKVNPLYSEGFDRVGCMPCINCGKQDILNIAARRPAEIARLAEWERLVGLAAKRKGASFFPNPNREKDADKRGIYKMVEWAKTTRGGRQFDLLRPAEELTPCASSFGLCEAPSGD